MEKEQLLKLVEMITKRIEKRAFDMADDRVKLINHNEENHNEELIKYAFQLDALITLKKKIEKA